MSVFKKKQLEGKDMNVNSGPEDKNSLNCLDICSQIANEHFLKFKPLNVISQALSFLCIQRDSYCLPAVF